MSNPISTTPHSQPFMAFSTFHQPILFPNFPIRGHQSHLGFPGLLGTPRSTQECSEPALGSVTSSTQAPKIAPQNPLGPRFRPATAAGSAPETFGVPARHPELQQTHLHLQIVPKRDTEGHKDTSQIWGAGSSRCWGCFMLRQWDFLMVIWEMLQEPSGPS